jgi:hypothetical protein
MCDELPFKTGRANVAACWNGQRSGRRQARSAVHGFENRKAFGNAIHLYIERAIHLWKFGEANPPAHGTKKTFNPMITGRHPTNMHFPSLPWNPQVKKSGPDCSEPDPYTARGVHPPVPPSPLYIVANIAAVNDCRAIAGVRASVSNDDFKEVATLRKFERPHLVPSGNRGDRCDDPFDIASDAIGLGIIHDVVL